MKKKYIDENYNPNKIAADQTIGDKQKIEELVRACHYYAERADELEKMPAQFDAFIEQHARKQHWSSGSNEFERIREIVSHYEEAARNANFGAERFRDQMVLNLRAISMCLEMTGNAGTHSEKNARLRGALEIIERIVSQLQEEKFDFSRTYWRFSVDSYRTDYPVRELLDSVHRLKEELSEKNKQLEAFQKSPAPDQETVLIDTPPIESHW